jgi:hypothetical protein
MLVSRGLVSYQVKNNIKYYKAEAPEQLIEEAGKNMHLLEDLAKDIVTTPVVPQSRNEVNIYEGKHGFKMAFTQHIDRMKAGEKVSIIGFSKRTYTQSKNAKELRTFFVGIDKFMIPKKTDARVLMDKTLIDVIKKERQDPSIYEPRHLPAGYFGPCAINISETEVLLSIWGETPIVFSIKNPIMIKTFQNNFDFLWSIAKSK